MSIRCLIIGGVLRLLWLLILLRILGAVIRLLAISRRCVRLLCILLLCGLRICIVAWVILLLIIVALNPILGLLLVLCIG